MLLCFNTQPPEGGWTPITGLRACNGRFQHTAARRRLAAIGAIPRVCVTVSTHSRPKAAGGGLAREFKTYLVSTHSRPKAAGQRLGILRSQYECFNTQPPEGGWAQSCSIWRRCVMFQHTAARRRLGRQHIVWSFAVRFQHTAARRRLGRICRTGAVSEVSTHSRPKAAGSLCVMTSYDY